MTGNSNSSDIASNVVSKAKIVLNKDAVKNKKKKLDVVQGSSSSTRQDESSMTGNVENSDNGRSDKPVINDNVN